MSRAGTATIDPLLTNYSQGIAQDTQSQDANFIAPRAPVVATVGRYKIYDAKNMFQAPETVRAMGGPAKRIKFESTDGTYNCDPNGLEITIDDDERNKAGDQQQRLEQNKVRTLITIANLAHANQVFTAARGALTAVPNFGVWSNGDNDPVDELDACIEAIHTDTAAMPNRMTLSLGVWRKIKQHPKVLNRIGTSRDRSLTLEQFAGLLLNPNIQIRLVLLAKDQAKWGNTENPTTITGADVLVYHASDNPTEYDLSFMKTFEGGTGGINAVYTYRDNSCRSDVFSVDWTVDPVVTCTVAGRKITVS